MRQLKSGTFEASIQYAGGPAKLTLAKGDCISEAVYDQLKKEQKRRFQKVTPEASDDADDSTDTPDAQ